MAAAFRSISGVDIAYRTTTTLSVPAGVVNGDKLIAFMFGANNGAAYSTIATPAGWTLVSGFPLTTTYSGYGCGITFWWRNASSEPASYNFTSPGGQEAEGFIIAVSGADTSAPIPSGVYGNGTTTNAPTITTTVDDSLVIFTSMKWDPTYGAATPPTGYTERRDPAASYCYAATAVRATAGATGTVSHANGNASSGYLWFGGLIGVTAATSGTTASGAGTAAGAATATATSVAAKTAAGTSAGVATATAVGKGAAPTTGTAAGSSTATAVGTSATLASGAGTAAGAATATATGASSALAIGAAIAGASGLATGQSAALATGVSDGAATAQATGSGTFAGSSQGTSAGTSTATAVSSTAIAAVGSSVGSSDAAAVGQGITGSVGEAVGPEMVTLAAFDKRAATNGTVTFVNGVLNFVPAASGLSTSVSHAISTIPRAQYRFKALVKGTSPVHIQARTADGGGGGVVSGSTFVTVQPTAQFTNVALTWTAQSSTEYATVNAGNANLAEVESVSVVQMPGARILGVGRANAAAVGTATAASTATATSIVAIASTGLAEGRASAVAIAYQDPSLFDGSGGGWLIKKRRELAR